jgi:hypothetical protein
MQTVKTLIFTNWHFARWIRLGLGVFVGVQSLLARDAFSGAIAAFLLFQALSNTGCCGASGCTTAPPESSDKKNDEIEFEEVKGK